jgi:hypothetical protein
MRPIRAITIALLVVVAVAVTGCGGRQSEQPAPSQGQQATTPPPGAKAPATTLGGGATGEPAVLPDGRHPVYLKRVDPAGRTITFDLIQWYSGEDAAREAAKDHQESPPPNDYYIRNVNPKLRTLPVGADATVTANQVAGSNKDVPVTLTRLAALTQKQRAVFWITVRQDQVVKISEQWVP